MPATWAVRVKSAAGALQTTLTGERGGYNAFSFTRRVNCPGSWALLMMRQAEETVAEFLARTSVFVLDGQIEFRRKWPEMSIAWYTDYEALVRDLHYYITQDGELIFEAAGRGYLDLINRRIVAAAAGSADAEKSGKAETIAKAYVTAQAGSGAGARALTGLTVEADSARGNTVPQKAAYAILLDTVQEIARIGGGNIDVVGVGAATFEFRWYAQRGTDRRSSVLFSYELGNMGSPDLNLARHDEVTAVLVGGAGEGASRTTVWRTDATRIAASTWNRIERFVDARSETTTAGLNAEGDKALDEGTPKDVLTFDVIQTPSCLYGKHYFFGDLVSSVFLGYSADKQLREYTVTVNESDSEELKLKMEDV